MRALIFVPVILLALLNQATAQSTGRYCDDLISKRKAYLAKIEQDGAQIDKYSSALERRQSARVALEILEKQDVLVDQWSPLVRSYVQLIRDGYKYACPKPDPVVEKIVEIGETLARGNDLMKADLHKSIALVRGLIQKNPNATVKISPARPGETFHFHFE